MTCLAVPTRGDPCRAPGRAARRCLREGVRRRPRRHRRTERGSRFPVSDFGLRRRRRARRPPDHAAHASGTSSPTSSRSGWSRTGLPSSISTGSRGAGTAARYRPTVAPGLMPRTSSATWAPWRPRRTAAPDERGEAQALPGRIRGRQQTARPGAANGAIAYRAEHPDVRHRLVGAAARRSARVMRWMRPCGRPPGSSSQRTRPAARGLLDPISGVVLAAAALAPLTVRERACDREWDGRGAESVKGRSDVRVIGQGRRHARHRIRKPLRDVRAKRRRSLRLLRQRGVHEHRRPALERDAAGGLHGEYEAGQTSRATSSGRGRARR